MVAGDKMTFDPPMPHRPGRFGSVSSPAVKRAFDAVDETAKERALMIRQSTCRYCCEQVFGEKCKNCGAPASAQVTVKSNR